MKPYREIQNEIRIWDEWLVDRDATFVQLRSGSWQVGGGVPSGWSIEMSASSMRSANAAEQAAPVNVRSMSPVSQHDTCHASYGMTRAMHHASSPLPAEGALEHAPSRQCKPELRP